MSGLHRSGGSDDIQGQFSGAPASVVFQRRRKNRSFPSLERSSEAEYPSEGSSPTAASALESPFDQTEATPAPPAASGGTATQGLPSKGGERDVYLKSADLHASGASQPEPFPSQSGLFTSFDERSMLRGEGGEVMAAISEQMRQQRTSRMTGKLGDKGKHAAGALALVASILGSSVLSAILSPSEAFLDERLYAGGFCNTFADPQRVCSRCVVVYTLACVVSLIFNLLTLLTTISVAIGLPNWLAMAYAFFVFSVLSLAVALISSIWITYEAATAVTGTVLLAMFILLSLLFMLPGIVFAWYHGGGISKVLVLDHTAGRSGTEKIVVEGSTPMHSVAFHRPPWQQLLVSVLLAAGENVDTPAAEGANGWTPLMIAAYKGNIEIVKQLLAAGANVEREDEGQSRGALHWAALKGQADVVEVLLKAGADPSKLDAIGNTAADLATSAGQHESSQTIDDWTKERLGEALLMAIKRRRHAEVQKLLAAGAPPQFHDERGSTALHWAANRGFFAGAEMLLNAGAVEVENQLGHTPLHEAVLAGSVPLVRLLSKRRAYRKGAKADSVLLLACKCGRGEVVQALLDAGAPADKAAVDVAAKCHTSVLRILLLRIKTDYACYSQLHAAAYIGSKAAMQLLLGDANKRRSQQPRVRSLSSTKLERSPVDYGDEQGTTALQLAVQEGHLEVVQFLLSEASPKAIVHLVDGIGRTALHWAAAAVANQAEIAEALLGAEADPNDEDDLGRTPLHWAATKGQAAVAKALLEAGADPTSMDHQQKTALQLAEAAGHRQVIEVLLAKDPSANV